MRLLSPLLALPLLYSAQALHFYFDSSEQRCFMEELPSNTVVEGHYRGLLWEESSQSWKEHADMGVQVTVEHDNLPLPSRQDDIDHPWTAFGVQIYRATTRSLQELNTAHVVVNTLGPPEGRFTFTSHEAGDHQICLSSNKTGGWINKAHIKLYLDVQVGSSKIDTRADAQHVETLAGKVRDLNNKLADIRREQRYMREVESTFRDASEKTNSRAVWWSIIQIAILIGTATWQMRYLRHYFADKKLR